LVALGFSDVGEVEAGGGVLGVAGGVVLVLELRLSFL
jgi:hypothetical protein